MAFGKIYPLLTRENMELFLRNRCITVYNNLVSPPKTPVAICGSLTLLGDCKDNPHHFIETGA